MGILYHILSLMGARHCSRLGRVCALCAYIFSLYFFLLFLSVCPFFSAVLIHTRVNHGRQTSMSEPLSTFTPTAAAARRRGADVILWSLPPINLCHGRKADPIRNLTGRRSRAFISQWRFMDYHDWWTFCANDWGRASWNLQWRRGHQCDEVVYKICSFYPAMLCIARTMLSVRLSVRLPRARHTPVFYRNGETYHHIFLTFG